MIDFMGKNGQAEWVGTGKRRCWPRHSMGLLADARGVGYDDRGMGRQYGTERNGANSI